MSSWSSCEDPTVQCAGKGFPGPENLGSLDRVCSLSPGDCDTWVISETLAHWGDHPLSCADPCVRFHGLKTLLPAWNIQFPKCSLASLDSSLGMFASLWLGHPFLFTLQSLPEVCPDSPYPFQHLLGSSCLITAQTTLHSTACSITCLPVGLRAGPICLIPVPNTELDESGAI